jgi:hypothetical protein
MAAIDTNLVVLDVATRWRIDAALFLLAAAGFLGWSIAASGAAGSLVAFAIEVCVGVALERWISTLPGEERLTSAGPLPAGARHGSAVRYAAEGVCWMLVLGVVLAVLAVVFADTRLYGGLLAAFAIVRLIGAARARRIERRDRVGLRVGVGSWRRRRTEGYYVTSPALWGVSGG